RPVGWAAAVATVVLAVVTLGVPRLERRLPAALPDGGPAAPVARQAPPTFTVPPTRAPAPLDAAATTRPAPVPPAAAPAARAAPRGAPRRRRPGCRAVGRRCPGGGRRRLPRPRLARAGAHPLARLREPRTDLRRRDPRPAGSAPAAAARTGGRVRRRRDRRVRRDHGGCGPRLPALSTAGDRRSRRALHPHRALRRRRQLSPADARAGRGSAVVSSILEALRELEASKAPAAPGTGAWTEERSRSRSALETIGIVAGGLALGAAAFALVIWLAGPTPKGVAESPGGAAPGSDAARPAAPPPQASEPAAGSAAPPAWLGRAEPPRARVAPEASPSEGMPAASRAPQAPAQPSGAASPAQDDSVVAVSAISYSPDVGRRSVTLRVGGTLVTLREGQSARGVEVQLILPGSVYVRRGAEITVLEPER